MKGVIASMCAMALLMAGAYFVTSNLSDQSLRSYDYTQHAQWQEFTQYMNDYQKQYENEYDLLMRFGIFIANRAEMDLHNSQKKNWTMAVNQFSDLTRQEFITNIASCEVPSDDEEELEPYEFDEDPSSLVMSSVNWKDKGYVTSVKNQGSCSSCYCFSAVALYEYAYKKKTGHLVEFSEQQAQDCTGGVCSHGGDTQNVLSYFKSHKAMKMSDYPYKMRTQKCAYSSSKAVGPSLSSYSQKAGSEKALRSAIEKGVVSVSVYSHNWHHYSGGIMSAHECGSTTTTHAVTLVGFSTSGNYWLIKNSWGTSFLERGYIRLAANFSSSGVGPCGVAKKIRTAYI